MDKSLQFLSGGGKMGELIRSFDWSKTAVGSPATWPQSLRIAARIMLDCPFGMYIAWGREYIQMYNDGYRPILGSTKHPQALGISTRKTFEEVWPTIGPMFDGVMQGSPIGFPDFILHLDRNGFVEECFFDFSYSPIRLEDGTVGGVLVTVIETTGKVKAVKALKESEQRFQNLVREANVGIIVVTGEEMRVHVVNEAYGRLIDLTPEELIGKPLFSMIPDAEETFRPILNKVRDSGESLYEYDQPYRVVTNGKVIEGYLNIVYQPFREADGTITGVSALCQDVTETLKNRKEIQESEERFRKLSQTIPHMIWSATPDGKKNFFNQYFIDYTGLSVEELSGDGWQSSIFPDDLEKEIEHWQHTLATGEDCIVEKRLRRKDGTYRWFLSHSLAQKDKQGNIIGWIGTKTEIEEQKVAEQKKDEFIGIASHEMRTPLTTAKGYLDLLLRSLNEDNLTFVYAAKAKQALQRLQVLITELLDASKIQNGQLNLNITSFDFNELLDETIENIQYSTKNHQIQKKGSGAQIISGDRDRLQQVLINLISNAVKYSPHADTLMVELKRQADKIEVAVQDFGVGICAQHLNKIFDRYYRVQEQALNIQGLGVGLYISKNIVDRHNGTMWAESEPGKGSTFYFSLPV